MGDCSEVTGTDRLVRGTRAPTSVEDTRAALDVRPPLTPAADPAPAGRADAPTAAQVCHASHATAHPSRAVGAHRSRSVVPGAGIGRSVTMASPPAACSGEAGGERRMDRGGIRGQQRQHRSLGRAPRPTDRTGSGGGPVVYRRAKRANCTPTSWRLAGCVGEASQPSRSALTRDDTRV
jgi:hypothetical protein